MADAHCMKSLFCEYLFFTNNNIFRHLKLEIASAIPALNDEKSNKQFSSTKVKNEIFPLAQRSAELIETTQAFFSHAYNI